MPCPLEGPGPLPWGVCLSLPPGQGTRPRRGRQRAEGLGRGPGLGTRGGLGGVLGCHPIERGDLSGLRGAGARKPPSASATLFTPAGFPSLSACLSALTSLSLSNSPPRICFLAAAHAFSGPGWHAELDSSAKVFPSGATLAHSPKALSGTGSGKGDEEEWSGRREPACLPASLRAPFCSGGSSQLPGRSNLRVPSGSPLQVSGSKFSLSVSSGYLGGRASWDLL